MIEVDMGVSGDSAANSQDMTNNYNSYPTLRTMSQTVYDGGGVGDGFVTKTRKFFGTGTNDFTGINYQRTYRGHLRGQEPFYMVSSTETPIGPYTVQDVDWKGRTTTNALYDTDPTWATVLTGDGYSAYASSTSSHRRTQQDTLYDDLGRVYQTKKYEISSSTGTGSNYLSTLSYYDRKGQLVATGDEYAFGTEIAFDGAGRSYQERTVVALPSTPYSSGVFNYTAPAPNPSIGSMSGGDAGVIKLSHQVIDANGNATEIDTFEANHDDLTGGSIGINLTNNNDYVRQTVFKWYDSATHLTALANYGSGDTASGAGQWKYAALPSRPSSAPTASSNTAMVALYTYNADSGLQETVTDPAATPTKAFYDRLGRILFVDENFSSFNPATPTGTGNPTDRVIQYVYDGPSRLNQFVSLDPNGDNNPSDNQTTTYLYEDAIDASRVTSVINPPSTDTTSSGTNQIKFTYNVDGSRSQKTDQLGTVISYTYTNDRLPACQSVSTLGTGVDGAVQSICRVYDNLDRPQNITSYSSTAGTGTVVNDIQYAYNDWSQVITAYQSHSGAVNTSSTLNVQYTYDTTASSSKFSEQHRIQTIVYPNGRTIYYDYGSSGAPYDVLARVRTIWNTNTSGTALATYDYNGNGLRLAVATLPEPSVKLDLWQGTSGTYAGLDRFGQTIDQYWRGFNTTSDVDRIHYAYDYAGNRTFRDIDAAIYPTNDLDQAFSYDTLHRLTAYDEGTLSGTTITGTPGREEDYSLDGLGNWSGYVTKSAGTTTLNQSRTSNTANQITNITASTGPSWFVPAYDAVGNATTISQPWSPTASYTATYDAFSRLVQLVDGTATVAQYFYDGSHNRIVNSYFTSGTLDHREHKYFNLQQPGAPMAQQVEVRKEVSGVVSTNPLEQFVNHPFYVDALVLRDYDASTSGTQVRNYYAYDANFNVTAIVDSSGSPLERYTYSPYGMRRVLNPNFSVATNPTQSSVANQVAFTGRILDPNSGLYYYRARSLDASVGAFIERKRDKNE